MLDYTLEEVLDFIENELCTAYESYRDDVIYDTLLNGEVSFSEAMSYYESVDDYFLEAKSDILIEGIKQYISTCEDILSKYKSTGHINEKLALIKAKEAKSKIHTILTIVLFFISISGQAVAPYKAVVGMAITIVGFVGAVITGILASSDIKKVRNTLDDVVHSIVDDIDDMSKSIEKVSKEDAGRLLRTRYKLIKAYDRYEDKINQEEIKNAINSTRY